MLHRTFWTLSLFWLVTVTSAMRILSDDALRCRTQGLSCTSGHSNCMDPGWLKVNQYTPSSPEDLQVSVETTQDAAGLLQPVLAANWTIRDDGSIRELKATELQVLMMSTNQNVCIRYSFKGVLPMRSPSGEKWSLSSKALVLDPGNAYHVSVFNIPKPEMGHSHYDVSQQVEVPGCGHASMQKTQFCVERGSLWRPDIRMERTNGSLSISFTPDQMCDEYLVLVRCSRTTKSTSVKQAGRTALKAAFDLAEWPRSCCQFDAEVKPFFPQCNNDCPRRRSTFSICVQVEPGPRSNLGVVCFFVGVVLVFSGVAVALLCFLCRRNKDKVFFRPNEKNLAVNRNQPPLEQAPKVLVIYSQDHHLYRDVVLKLCAFLQAKCGTKVLVDLLDSTSVGMVGRVRWLEWQRRQLRNPSDKILVLCSRGVQAKWRAMCGQEKVLLKEDVLSPTDDMLTPFLNLFLPELHQAAKLGRYMVAYFDDISSESDVPSVFDIAVKFNLMKHFEELFFRILDVEKYEPGHILHIEGISGEEYSHCASGLALKNAIDAFRAHQLEHPDWFEKECVVGEEEALPDAERLPEHVPAPPVLECVLPVRAGPPVYVRDVEVGGPRGSVQVLTPRLTPEHRLPSLTEHLPLLQPPPRRPPSPGQVLAGLPYPAGPAPGPGLNRPPTGQSQPLREEELVLQVPTEHDETWSSLPSCPPAHLDQGYPLLGSRAPEPSEVRLSDPVEMDEGEVPEPGRRAPSSGSDQGYSSRVSSQQDVPLLEDPLAKLARLQDQLFQRSFDL